MVYRGWSIGTYPSFLGFTAQATSPIGRAYPTGGHFASEGAALAYAQRLVDDLIHGEWRGLAPMPEPAAAG